MQHRSNLDPDSLLIQTAWVRRLAHGLTHDPDRADDLVQSTWVAALERPPATNDNLRGWLRTVLRNFWAQGRRGDDRRQRRERFAARDEKQPSAAELVERMQVQRRVVEAVLALSEHYRTVVILRYFENQPPRKIAERLDIAVATVKTRLHRALQQLRLDLDELHEGDRGAWTTALSLLAAGHKSWSWIPIGATLMKAQTAILSCFAVAVGIALAWPLLLSRPEPVPIERTADDDSLAMAAETGETPTATVTRTQLHPPPGQTVATIAQANFRGRVIDIAADPLANVKVALLPVFGNGKASGEARTDSQGQFAMPLPESTRRIVVDDASLITVLASQVSPHTAIDTVAVTVATRAIAVDVTVFDEFGAPIPRAHISCVLPPDFRTRFREILDGASAPLWQGETDQDGRLDGLHLGVIPEAELLARADGFLPERVEAPTFPTNIAITLRRPDSRDSAILGQVTDLGGSPVANALIAMGSAESASGPDGYFALPVAAAGRARRLVAMKHGFQSAQRRIRDEEMPGGGSLTFVHMRLGPPPLSITGPVVDTEGRPVSGVKVWIDDPTVFGRIRRRTVPVESYLAQADPVGWTFVVTNGDGGFGVKGLLDRDYLLGVLDSSTQSRQVAGPFRAGATAAKVTLNYHGVQPEIAGRVVSRIGDAVPDVRIRAKVDTLALVSEAGNETIWDDDDGKSTTSDGDGRFTLGALAVRGVVLDVRGDRIMPERFHLSDSEGVLVGHPNDLRIEVALRLHIQINLVDPEWATQVGMFDASGRRIVLELIEGNTRTLDYLFPLFDGKSAVLAVPDQATTVVLYRGDTEVSRQPVTLSAGEVNVIRL